MRSSEVVLPGPFLMSPEGQFSTSLDSRSPGSRLGASIRLPGQHAQWLAIGSRLAAYSCGGSAGLGPRPVPASLSSPEGHRRGIGYHGARGPASGARPATLGFGRARRGIRSCSSHTRRRQLGSFRGCRAAWPRGFVRAGRRNRSCNNSDMTGHGRSRGQLRRQAIRMRLPSVNRICYLAMRRAACTRARVPNPRSR